MHKRYRKKPIEVEAVQHLEGIKLPPGFLRDDEEIRTPPYGSTSIEVRRTALVGTTLAALVLLGEWLVRNPDGSLSTVPAKVFEATYEEVTPDAA